MQTLRGRQQLQIDPDDTDLILGLLFDMVRHSSLSRLYSLRRMWAPGREHFQGGVGIFQRQVEGLCRLAMVVDVHRVEFVEYVRVLRGDLSAL